MQGDRYSASIRGLAATGSALLSDLGVDAEISKSRIDRERAKVRDQLSRRHASTGFFCEQCLLFECGFFFPPVCALFFLS